METTHTHTESEEVSVGRCGDNTHTDSGVLTVPFVCVPVKHMFTHLAFNHIKQRIYTIVHFNV